ncbi:MAG: type VI secretion system TssO, partial [Tangfeifania sp.]
MKPLNKKERNKAFFKVVGLFLISFIIALILGFTTMNYGTVSEQQTKNELEKLKTHLKFQEEIFAPNVGETTNLLSKIPTYKEEGENIEVLNQDIGAILSQTKNQAVEDESWESVMYKDVINALSDLQLAYNEQMKLREQMGDS